MSKIGRSLVWKTIATKELNLYDVYDIIGGKRYDSRAPYNIQACKYTLTHVACSSLGLVVSQKTTTGSSSSGRNGSKKKRGKKKKKKEPTTYYGMEVKSSLFFLCCPILFWFPFFLIVPFDTFFLVFFSISFTFYDLK